jgi:hypothetical protein
LLNGNVSNVADVTWQCEDIRNLSMIFAGAHDERSPEYISSQRAADLFAEISGARNDRIVIFDTPPALASAETANLAGYMNHVILVVAWGESNRHHVQKALDNVSACRNVSLVFNKAPKWQKLNSDYYYYYTDDKNVEEALITVTVGVVHVHAVLLACTANRSARARSPVLFREQRSRAGDGVSHVWHQPRRRFIVITGEIGAGKRLWSSVFALHRRATYSDGACRHDAASKALICCVSLRRRLVEGPPRRQGIASASPAEFLRGAPAA